MRGKCKSLEPSDDRKGELGDLFPDEAADLSLNLPVSLVPPEQVRDMQREAPRLRLLHLHLPGPQKL